MGIQTKGGARAGALAVLQRIEEGGYANLALDSYLEGPGRQLSRQDKGLLTELVQGVVKYRLTLDWIIDQLVQKNQKLKQGPRILLRLGLYQLSYMGGIPDRAATFETVQLAKINYHSGVASLVNGVLRSWLRQKDQFKWPDEAKDPAGYLSVYYSHPRWMVERWLERYGLENTRSFCLYNNSSPRLWLRTNTLRTTAAELKETLIDEGCQVEEGSFAPEALALLEGPGLRNLVSFQKGLFTVQDESSMLAAHGLSPERGQRVLDTCAAPGGKTTHLAQLMEDQGSITAWDIHPHRVELIRENQRRLGISCIEAAVFDASADLAEQRQSLGLFQRILVDAPCSGLGVLRRRADARWNKSPEDIRQLTDLQKKILTNALSLLAPGGRLLYSTCTVEPEENRLLVEEVLAAHPQYKKGSLALPVVKEENRQLLPEPAKDWDMQFLPFLHGLEGFYMAAIEKEAGAGE